MSTAVIDASVVLRWAFEDEPDRRGALHIRDALMAGTLNAIGAPNFLLEVASVLLLGLRSGRIDADTTHKTMNALGKVSIPEHEAFGFATACYDLALRVGIKVPDAAYVETALREGAPIISADLAQLRAAITAGVVAIPLASVEAGLT